MQVLGDYMRKPVEDILTMTSAQQGLSVVDLRDPDNESENAVFARKVAAALLSDKKVGLAIGAIEDILPLGKSEIRNANKCVDVGENELFKAYVNIYVALNPPPANHKPTVEPVIAPTYENVVGEVAKEAKVTVESLSGARVPGSAAVPRPERDVAVFLCLKLVGMDFGAISERFKIKSSLIRTCRDRVMRSFDSDRKNPRFDLADKICRKFGTDLPNVAA